jgi:hypothetical protein
MIVLIGSAIAAPMIGEIGQTSGSYTTGAGSANANAVIAYILLGPVVIGCAGAFGWLRDRLNLLASWAATIGRAETARAAGRG